MTVSKLTVDEIFALLSEHNSNYQLRSQQLQMAYAVQQAFQKKEIGVFEAGTGTGKSFAALVPAVLSGKRIVISTATIALQEQYIYKDIPALFKVLPFELKAVIMKGRSNYLSIRRYNDMLAKQEIAEEIVDWTNSTIIGDVSELNFMPSRDVWHEINSDKDDCLRNKCPTFNDCFYFKSKRAAEEANIIIVNHALLLADAASSGNILPKYELLIVDEAHHMADIARDTFGLAISNRGLKYLVSKANKQLSAPAHLVNNIIESGDELFLQLALKFAPGSSRIRNAVSEAELLQDALYHFKFWLESQEFENLLDIEMAREKAKLKAAALLSTVNAYLHCLDLLQHPDENWVVWTERDEGIAARLEIIATPLKVASYMQDLLLDKSGLESSIWMSATLATGGEDIFGYFKEHLGINEHTIQDKFSSPFDYKRQALLYLPPHLPDPNDKQYVIKAAEEIEKLVRFSRGRAFILFTSYQAMNISYELLKNVLPYDCRKQGEMPRKQLIDWFLSTYCGILFGTSSFWEGVSIDGDQLSCVIIDRIPFQSPEDPIYEAQCEFIQQTEGRNWFTELALPHAIMRLKQGVGRLIRTESDSGIVAILDPRLTRKSYGKQIIECLPPMKIIQSISENITIEELLESI